jgi:hypothetical protein
MENMINTTPIPSTLVSSSNKRKRKHTSETVTTTPSGIEQDNAPPSLKKRRPNSIHFFVWTQKNASFPQSVELEHSTTDELKVKLSTLLQLHPTRIADILWRRKKQLKENDLSSNEKKETGSPSKKDSRKQNDLLVLVEDSFITEHIYEGLIIVVEWEIKSDGNVNLILDF